MSYFIQWRLRIEYIRSWNGSTPYWPVLNWFCVSKFSIRVVKGDLSAGMDSLFLHSPSFSIFPYFISIFSLWLISFLYLLPFSLHPRRFRRVFFSNWWSCTLNLITRNQLEILSSWCITNSKDCGGQIRSLVLPVGIAQVLLIRICNKRGGEGIVSGLLLISSESSGE